MSFPLAIERQSMNIHEDSNSTYGILQLAMITSDSYLTVKILRVKHVQSISKSFLIKLTLIPDRYPLECRTRFVSNRHGSILFNEQFTFEINDDDRNKRLCFSLYQSENNELHFRGCLSFGIDNTIKKQRISGWFHLLPEDIGEFRHKICKQSDGKSVSSINRDIADLQEHRFLLNRNNSGCFGFTVIGDSPCSVGQVTERSRADQIGLKSGDFIVKINGQNVSRAQQKTVAQLIKQTKHSLTLDIHRYPTVTVRHHSSSIGTISIEDSATSSESSFSSNRHLFPMSNCSLLARQGSPMMNKYFS